MDEKVVDELLELAKNKRHDEVKKRLAKVNRATQHAFKERYRKWREQRKRNNGGSTIYSAHRPSPNRAKAVVLYDFARPKVSSLALKEYDVVDVVEKKVHHFRDLIALLDQFNWFFVCSVLLKVEIRF